jgi:hypothetical protein
LRSLYSGESSEYKFGLKETPEYFTFFPEFPGLFAAEIDSFAEEEFVLLESDFLQLPNVRIEANTTREIKRVFFILTSK